MKISRGEITSMQDFIVLSNQLGAESMGWRYDPIFLNCMTKAIYEQALGGRLNVPANKSQRKEYPKGHQLWQRFACQNKESACLLGRDIGQYDTCGHLCKYCYANSDKNAVRANMRLHNPKSPLLVGRLLDTDVVHEAKQESCYFSRTREK